MFQKCKLSPNKNLCPFAGTYKKEQYCGIAKNISKISLMSKCPYKPKKRITTLTNYLSHLK
jgi:hypothetical protein